MNFMEHFSNAIKHELHGRSISLPFIQSFPQIYSNVSSMIHYNICETEELWLREAFWWNALEGRVYILQPCAFCSRLIFRHDYRIWLQGSSNYMENLEKIEHTHVGSILVFDTLPQVRVGQENYILVCYLGLTVFLLFLQRVQSHFRSWIWQLFSLWGLNFFLSKLGFELGHCSYIGA